jgi:hypothetical protein
MKNSVPMAVKLASMMEKIKSAFLVSRDFNLIAKEFASNRIVKMNNSAPRAV